MVTRPRPEKGAAPVPWCAEKRCRSLNRPCANKKGAPQRALACRRSIAALALRELEAPARLGLAVLLALDHARIAGEEAAALERVAQVRLEIGQRLRDAVAHRAGLSRQSAARDRADHVILAGSVGGDDRLLDQHAQHRPREKNLDGALIDQNLAGAGLDPYARDRILALAGRVGAALLVELLDVFRRLRGGGLQRAELVERLHGFGHGHALLVFLRFMAAMSSASGCCAACGWSGPL